MSTIRRLELVWIRTHLAMLPEDGDLSDLHTVQPVESQGVTLSNETTATEDEEGYSSSFVPNAAPPATQRETIEQAIQSLGQPQSSHLMWPSIGGTPINEFQTEGYFSMAFPTLFPTGKTIYIYAILVSIFIRCC